MGLNTLTLKLDSVNSWDQGHNPNLYTPSFFQPSQGVPLAYNLLYTGIHPVFGDEGDIMVASRQLSSGLDFFGASHGSAPVIIIGGGASGLTCARYLQQWQVPFLLLEGSNRVGGRLATEQFDDYLLDRGFQVYLSSYPEAQSLIPFDALEAHPFVHGAQVWMGDGFQAILDPIQHPFAIVQTLMSRVGSFEDKMLLMSLRKQSLQTPIYDPFSHAETSTLDYLKSFGFSETFIQQFFKPFFGGIFLDPDLKTSSRLFQFLFRIFSTAQTVLPAQGIQALAQSLAKPLHPEALILNSVVQGISPNSVTLASGQQLDASGVVVATDAQQAHHLCGIELPKDWHSTTTVYFKAPRSPVTMKGSLVLNGVGPSDGPINTLCVPSDVQPTYAPSHHALISVSVLGIPSDTQALAKVIINQAKGWFGRCVDEWEFLKAYPIDHALPDFSPPTPKLSDSAGLIEPGLVVCGDYLAYPSLNGAMWSGRQAARHAASYFAKQAQNLQPTMASSKA